MKKLSKAEIKFIILVLAALNDGSEGCLVIEKSEYQKRDRCVAKLQKMDGEGQL